jgi:hypothetical protein
MKITGLILAIIGLIAGAIVLSAWIQPTAPDRDAPATATSTGITPNVVFPLIICAAAVIVGGLLVLLGGKGYRVSNNPRVRN